MPIRFRKSIKLAPGLRMNLSSGGVGWNIGTRGASIGIGKRGVHANAGFAGVSMRQQLAGPTGAKSTRATSAAATRDQIELSVTVGVSDDGTVFFKDPSGNALPEAIAKVAMAQQAGAISRLIAEKCTEINAQIEAVGDLHLDTPRPNEAPKYYALPFDEPAPTAPTSKHPGFFGRFVRSVRNRIDAENAAAIQVYETDLRAWNARKDAHATEEAARRDLVERRIYMEISAMEEMLEAALQYVAWPRETLVALSIDDSGRQAFIDVDLPEIEDMPSKIAAVPARGLKLSVKELSPTAVQRLYMRHVHSIAFRAIGESFAALPVAQQIVVSGYSQRSDKKTAQVGDEYLYSVRVGRQEWAEIDFDNLAKIDIVEALTRFELRRSMSKTGVFKPVEPFTTV